MFTLDLETNKAARYEVHGERINHGYARLLGIPTEKVGGRAGFDKRCKFTATKSPALGWAKLWFVKRLEPDLYSSLHQCR